MYFKTFAKNECSGCTACIAACPKKCIVMEADNEGFLYPVVNKNDCIDCGLCERICPFEHPKYDNIDTPKVYATYIKDESQRVQSSSGGIFYSIAKWIIEQNGIVYGAAFDENFKLKHIGVDTLEELSKLRGSKYLQSNLGNVFSEIRKYLNAGRWVYFVGVGCQVAGLKAFLRKNYDTLITSDLVCHGVPSQLMFDWHIDYLKQKEKGKIISYSFRDYRGWGGCETYKYVSQTRGEGVRRLYSYILSPYLYSFMYAYNYRYSCYNCKFSKIPRQGDITLADYWGVKNFFPDMDISKGVSLVLLNTHHGDDIWSKIKNEIHSKESCIKDAAKENANLISKTLMPEIRKHCYDIILQRGYKSVAEKEFRCPNYRVKKIRITLTHSWVGKVLKILRNKLK